MSIKNVNNKDICYLYDFALFNCSVVLLDSNCQ